MKYFIKSSSNPSFYSVSDSFLMALFLIILFWLFYFGYPVLIILFWLSCFDYPVLIIQFWLSCFDYWFLLNFVFWFFVVLFIAVCFYILYNLKQPPANFRFFMSEANEKSEICGWTPNISIKISFFLFQFAIEDFSKFSIKIFFFLFFNLRMVFQKCQLK